LFHFLSTDHLLENPKISISVTCRSAMVWGLIRTKIKFAVQHLVPAYNCLFNHCLLNDALSSSHDRLITLNDGKIMNNELERM
jgi:hypothetical protein